MLLFLDTEFTDFIDIDLISIGLVSEDGHHLFYAERNDYRSFRQKISCGMPAIAKHSVRWYVTHATS